MVGKIALVGGDEFLPSCRQMDNKLIEATGYVRPKVLIVPTAAAMSRPELAARHGVQQFEALGADASPLMVLTGEDANSDDLTAPVEQAEIVYLSGGNPAHLLDVLRGSLLLRRLMEGLERGMILAGSSAGAMVMGERMRFRQWGGALGVVPGIAVLPHHERASKSQTVREVVVETPEEITLIGIDGATGCFREDEGWRVLGAGSVTLYGLGTWQTYRSGEYFEIEGK